MPSKPCPPGCECARHKAYYRGGSKKGRKLSEQARRNIAEAAKRRKYKPGTKERLAELARAQNADPEFKAKRIAALKAAKHTCEPDCTCERHSEETRRRIAEAARERGPLSEDHKEKIGEGSRKAWAAMSPEQLDTIRQQRSEAARKQWLGAGFGVRTFYKVSQLEHHLAPYLATMGYRHNDSSPMRIGRKIPDFVDEQNRRVFELFGDYWHPRSEEEIETVDYYAQYGWQCTVLWEHDLCDWLSEHRERVSTDEHRAAWKAARRSYQTMHQPGWQSKRHMS